MEQTPDVLRNITSEGSLESSGSFTLDANRMESKLAQHQLPTCDHYMLKFVQSAVAAGASEIRLKPPC